MIWSQLALSAELPKADETTFKQTIAPILQKHCIRCHGEKKQEASFRVDRLGPDILKEKTAGIWHELINRVNSGEMPPEKQPPLSEKELNQLSQWVFAGLRRVADASQDSGGRVVVRRLNRQEYNNTIRDLVGVPFEAGADFPDDPAAHGFDNVGSALSISPLHMEKYVLAARKVIDRAIVVGEQPKRECWRIQAERRSKESRGYYYENDMKYGNTVCILPKPEKIVGDSFCGRWAAKAATTIRQPSFLIWRRSKRPGSAATCCVGKTSLIFIRASTSFACAHMVFIPSSP